MEKVNVHFYLEYMNALEFLRIFTGQSWTIQGKIKKYIKCSDNWVNYIEYNLIRNIYCGCFQRYTFSCHKHIDKVSYNISCVSFLQLLMEFGHMFSDLHLSIENQSYLIRHPECIIWMAKSISDVFNSDNTLWKRLVTDIAKQYNQKRYVQLLNILAIINFGDPESIEITSHRSIHIDLIPKWYRLKVSNISIVEISGDINLRAIKIIADTIRLKKIRNIYLITNQAWKHSQLINVIKAIIANHAFHSTISVFQSLENITHRYKENNLHIFFEDSNKFASFLSLPGNSGILLKPG
ncbi:MAG: hypothetical protein ACD_3C00086G0026 [uncultured bacterium (gcode 4)]|uniref:Uncharacterized protein n=1 Tax=uncultured bacterium (gcode 4) TaxID=1234023 RepID=K2G1T8_9BACT|nr:MAG: hypothetical protein ACD_3C00086G0026 [uncultured bacterium (gcode 4)]